MLYKINFSPESLWLIKTRLKIICQIHWYTHGTLILESDDVTHLTDLKNCLTFPTGNHEWRIDVIAARAIRVNTFVEQGLCHVIDSIVAAILEQRVRAIVTLQNSSVPFDVVQELAVLVPSQHLEQFADVDIGIVARSRQNVDEIRIRLFDHLTQSDSVHVCQG